MITIADIINYIEEKSNIIIVDSYKDFLMQFLKLIKPVEFECLLNDKIQLLCLDNLYNVIDLSQMIALRSSYPELIENQLVFIGGFIGGESLCLGIGATNSGKIYYSDTDLYDFVEIAPDFESFISLLNFPQC